MSEAFRIRASQVAGDTGLTVRAVTAMAKRGEIPDAAGFVLVPKVATEEMCEAGAYQMPGVVDVTRSLGDAREIYTAMIAAHMREGK